MKIKGLLKKYKEIVLYLIFGVLTTLISLVTYFLLTNSLLNPSNPVYLQVANIISWIISVTFAYITNRKYVFNSNNGKLKEITKFYTSRILSLILDLLIMGIGVSVLHYNHKIIKIISQVVVIIFNYLISKLIVFKKDSNLY